MALLKNQSSLWPNELAEISRTEINRLDSENSSQYEKLLSNESIPLSSENKDLLRSLYIPLSNWLSEQKKTFTLGINGAQGSGKTTFSKILKQILVNSFKKSVVIISIDDLYLTKAERLQLSHTMHPLLATRGVPGTHDIKRGLKIFKKLKSNDNSPIHIPTFNKASDDRNNYHSWKIVTEKPDIILFEGWCVGAVAESEATLNIPINSLEEKEDSSGEWRQYVNTQLKTNYSELFSQIDELIMLRIPHYKKILEWRTLQENKLKQSTPESTGMNETEMLRFIMHYERITRNTLKEMPARAKLVFEINSDHYITNTLFNNEVLSN